MGNRDWLGIDVHDPQRLKRFGHSSANALGSTVRVLVWNMFKARRSHWAHDFQMLSADCDLVLLQEAVLNALTDRLFYDHRHLSWIMGQSHRHPIRGETTGVQTGCRVAALSCKLQVSAFSEPVLNTRKLLLATEYPLVGSRRHLLTINMHAINFVSLQKYFSHLDQLGEALVGHDGPVILGGDFNTWRSARLRSFRSVCQGAGLEEAQWARNPRLGHLNKHIDHLAYRGFVLESIENLDHITSSDHLPIRATLRLQS